jgi:hypothetical protein
MKSKFLLFSHSRLAACSLILGLGVLVGGLAQAQIIVGNAKFDNPLSYPGLNWTVVYVKGGPSDFACKGRTTRATYTGGGAATGYGGNFKPFHDAPMHAYFTQTISNLTAGASYAVTNWMHKPGGGDEGWYEGARVYLEVVGGMGSVTSEYVTDYPNVYPQVWKRFGVTNTANASGQLEIRMHFSHDGASGDKWYYIDGWYDDVGVTALSAQPPMLPYKILAFTIQNQNATIEWETVATQLYSVQASPDLSTWTTIESNLLATGSSLTFSTNVSGSPQYFRIHRP